MSREQEMRIRAAEIAGHLAGCVIGHAPGQCSCGMLGRRPEALELAEDAARRAALGEGR